MIYILSKMEKINLLIFFIFNLKLIINYDYSSIKENIPVKSSLYFSQSFYKIYEYVPPCEQNEYLNKVKNIFVKLDNNVKTTIYIYDNFQNIFHNEEGKFFNYSYNDSFLMEFKKYNNFICQKNITLL